MILGNLGLHVIQFPSKRFGFVGSIPTALGEIVPATTSDVMAGRAHRSPTGEILTIRFPTFDTESEALAHATAHGFTANTSKVVSK